MGQGCSIDLWKALETIDFSVLMKKVDAFGYRGPFLETLRDCFRSRFQYIETD